jgi:hypothetical protein
MGERNNNSPGIPMGAGDFQKFLERMFADYEKFHNKQLKSDEVYTQQRQQLEKKAGVTQLIENRKLAKEIEANALKEYEKRIQEQRKLAEENESERETAMVQLAKLESEMYMASLQYEINDLNHQKELAALRKQCAQDEQDILDTKREGLTIYERELSYRDEASSLLLDNVDLERENSEILKEISSSASRIAELKGQQASLSGEELDNLNQELLLLETKKKLHEDALSENALAIEENKRKADEAMDAELKMLEIKKRAAALMQNHGVGQKYSKDELSTKTKEKDNKEDDLVSTLDELASVQVEIEELNKQLEDATKNNDTAAIENLTNALKEKTTQEDLLIKESDILTKDIGKLSEEIDQLELDKIANRDTKQEAKDNIKKRAEEAANKKKDLEAKKAEKDLVKETYMSGDDTYHNMVNAAAMDELGNQLTEAMDGLGKKFASALDEFSKTIDNNITSFYQYQAQINARLQGSDETYQKMLSKMSAQLAFNPYVRQTDMVNKIKEAVDNGIAYNADLRAFLATVSENIAQTFDAFDANLLKIIRVQQADTTAARLGMEASLTKLFNNYFSDTSYLSDAFDGVTGALVDASAQLNHQAAMEFEYIVQKWLGALYSVGFSQETINTIAQGINYLGTGNVEALNGNDSLNSLMAMSATRAGISYADILTSGLDAKTTNDLLKSMVEYLQSIANNTDNNQVTKSAYTNIFGMNMTDLRAVSNLTASDVSNLHSEFVNYSGAMDELTNQFGEIIKRIHYSTFIDNMVANAAASASTGIGNNPAIYGMWKVLNIVEGLTGGIHIPAFSVMGNMVDLSQFTIEGIAKTGIAGLGLMSQLLSGLFSGGSLNPFSLDAWGFDETTSRGSKVKGLTGGIASGFSESNQMSMTGSSSSGDVKNTGMSDKTDEADKDKDVTNKNVKDESDIYKQIYAAIADDSTSVLKEVVGLNAAIPSIVSEVAAISALLALDRKFITMGAPDASLMTKLDDIKSAIAAISLQPAGSHATGLSVVPYDGYIAELHEGEAVLTKAQAQLWRQELPNVIVDRSIVTTSPVNDSMSVSSLNVNTLSVSTSTTMANSTSTTDSILLEMINNMPTTDSVLLEITNYLSSLITDANSFSENRLVSNLTDISNGVTSATPTIVSAVKELKEVNETDIDRLLSEQSTVLNNSSVASKMTGLITDFSSIVDNQQHTIESIASISAMNNATMLSIGQSNRELQREIQKESSQKSSSVNTTSTNSATNNQFTSTESGNIPNNFTGNISSINNISPEEFIRLLVDRLGGLEIKVTDMPGTDSTSPLYTIGGGTP